MLTPETLHALTPALDAVIKQAGDDPQYAELVEHLQAAREAMPDGPDDQHDESASHSFQDAKERMIAARKGGEQE